MPCTSDLHRPVCKLTPRRCLLAVRGVDYTLYMVLDPLSSIKICDYAG